MKPMKHGNAMKHEILGNLLKHLLKYPGGASSGAMPKEAHIEIDAVKAPTGEPDGDEMPGAGITDGDGDEGQAAIRAMHAKDREKMRG